ncbi:glycosyl hydrolase family 65 protein [Nostocoides sp. Soil756]|uniref:glycoside hydrolase family 65 protein n=1 Tax=Nostocoides sp. Soil756 TaxID=1736399 RepID=UPI0006F975C5|nr:glycosyl hydrolase family 65 protein [Tetrasphaera sp. Soil756]KRE61301.1 kojibiose phosphorylase [Tetrasphaera sp. Soil756]
MRSGRVGADPLDRTRFPADPWRLVETAPDLGDLGLTETLFAVANGYIGLRANPEEGREAHAHGTFVNGFHETWPIRHAEAAYGFARTGQTIVDVPDAKLMKLYVDDEPLVIGMADLEEYERSLDLRDGILRRSLVWRTPSGKRVRVESSRMVSMTERHLVVLTLEVTMLSGDAPVVVSSQLLNRLDGEDEYYAPAHTSGTADPRRAGTFEGRVLLPHLHAATEHRLVLGHRCRNSAMTVAVMADHTVRCTDPYEVVTRAEDDLAKAVHRVEAREGHTLRIEKLVAYHTSRGLPVRELADRCERTLDRTGTRAVEDHHGQQREWYDRFWAGADIEIGAGAPHAEALQQAVRYNLFSLAQAAGRADQHGIAAKGVTGSGYEGHYFWDSEVYVAPFLTYTQPELARNLLAFRSRMLPAARERAREMSQPGALFPWRTINGEEASAYYAAGTAQVHIDADVAHALVQYVAATDDVGFLVRDGVAILVETARMYAALGFWRSNGDSSFHIHGVTGPDEYTTVVNNNLFTNVMARANLEQAVRAVERVRREHPLEWARLDRHLQVRDDEPAEWQACADGMHIPFDEGLGIHPQDDFFLDREVWDLSRTPLDVRPLLLHYHPLVIYRFQVLKQADVVLALYLQGDRFTAAQKRADFEYYDPITTGDSSLSAVVQSVVAAEVGYHEAAYEYFCRALYVDLADLHDNTVDGLHIASAAGVWATLVGGFGGMRDHGGMLRFDPRLPEGWGSLTFRLTWRGSRLRVRLAEHELELTVEEGAASVPVEVRGQAHEVAPGTPVVVTLDGHGERLSGLLGRRPRLGGTRADGSRITAGVPDPIPFEVVEPFDGPVTDAR